MEFKNQGELLNMNNEPGMQKPPTAPEATPESSSTETQETDTSTRRELIQRYVKYALVAGPMLLFVSKAHAIHSRP